MSDLIHLQNAHVTQYSSAGSKGHWFVRMNQTSEDLHELPAELNESQVFAVMDFARKFELEALNAGIEFQKGKQDKALQQQNDALRKALKESVTHSDALATKLQKLIIHSEN